MVNSSDFDDKQTTGSILLKIFHANFCNFIERSMKRCAFSKYSNRKKHIQKNSNTDITLKKGEDASFLVLDFKYK